MDNFYENEFDRELKNDMLTSLLIKFICRTLPNEPKESQSRDLFEMIKEKNMNLPKQILKELDGMKNIMVALLSDVIDITLYFVKRRKPSQKNANIVEAPFQQEKENENNDDDNDGENDEGDDDDDEKRKF